MSVSQLFTNALLVDGSGAPAVTDAALRVERGVITHVGTVNDVASWPDSDETIDVAGAPLVPGYIDIHHHGGGKKLFIRKTFHGTMRYGKISANNVSFKLYIFTIVIYVGTIPTLNSIANRTRKDSTFAR